MLTVIPQLHFICRDPSLNMTTVEADPIKIPFLTMGMTLFFSDTEKLVVVNRIEWYQGNTKQGDIVVSDTRRFESLAEYQEELEFALQEGWRRV